MGIGRRLAPSTGGDDGDDISLEAKKEGRIFMLVLCVCTYIRTGEIESLAMENEGGIV